MAGAALLVLALIVGIGLIKRNGSQVKTDDEVVAKPTPIATPPATPIETPVTTPVQPPKVELRWTEIPATNEQVLTPHISLKWEADNAGEVIGYNVLLNGEVVARQLARMSYVLTFKTTGRQQIEIVPILPGGTMGEALKRDFEYENKPPILSLVDPAGETLQIKESDILPIRVKASDPGGESVRIDYRIDQGPWIAMASGSAELGPLKPARHELEIRALDLSGLSSNLTRWIEVQARPTPSPTPTPTPSPSPTPTPTPSPTPRETPIPAPKIQKTPTAKTDTTSETLKTVVPMQSTSATLTPMPSPTPASESMATTVSALTPAPTPTLEPTPLTGTVKQADARIVIDRIAKVITDQERGGDIVRDYYLLIDRRYRLSKTSPSELHPKLRAAKENIAKGYIEYLSVEPEIKQSRGNEFAIKVTSRDNRSGETKVEIYRIKLERQNGRVIFAGDYKVK